MSDLPEFGTALPTIEYLRDEVRPLAEKMVSKHTAPYSDLLAAADRDELVGSVLEKYFKKWGRSDGVPAENGLPIWPNPRMPTSNCRRRWVRWRHRP